MPIAKNIQEAGLLKFRRVLITMPGSPAIQLSASVSVDLSIDGTADAAGVLYTVRTSAGKVIHRGNNLNVAVGRMKE